MGSTLNYKYRKYIAAKEGNIKVRQLRPLYLGIAIAGLAGVVAGGMLILGGGVSHYFANAPVIVPPPQAYQLASVLGTAIAATPAQTTDIFSGLTTNQPRIKPQSLRLDMVIQTQESTLLGTYNYANQSFTTTKRWPTTVKLIKHYPNGLITVVDELTDSDTLIANMGDQLLKIYTSISGERIIDYLLDPNNKDIYLLLERITDRSQRIVVYTAKQTQIELARTGQVYLDRFTDLKTQQLYLQDPAGKCYEVALISPSLKQIPNCAVALPAGSWVYSNWQELTNAKIAGEIIQESKKVVALPEGSLPRWPRELRGKYYAVEYQQQQMADGFAANPLYVTSYLDNTPTIIKTLESYEIPINLIVMDDQLLFHFKDSANGGEQILSFDLANNFAESTILPDICADQVCKYTILPLTNQL